MAVGTRIESGKTNKRLTVRLGRLLLEGVCWQAACLFSLSELDMVIQC